MEIKAEDINLKNFLKFFKPELDKSSEKIPLPNADFLIIATLLKYMRDQRKIK